MATFCLKTYNLIGRATQQVKWPETDLSFNKQTFTKAANKFSF